MQWTVKSVVLTPLTTATVAAQSVRTDTALIAGADAGLGLQFTEDYAERGWDVVCNASLFRDR